MRTAISPLLATSTFLITRRHPHGRPRQQHPTCGRGSADAPGRGALSAPSDRQIQSTRQLKYTARLDYEPVTAAIRLLVVDDDPAIVQIYQDVLQRDGYEVVTAASCAEALQRMESLAGDVQVLIVDLGLPDCDGADFARSSAARFGPRPALYVSGWTDEFWQLDDIPGQWLIMRKPVPIRQLLAAVKWLVQGGPKPGELDEPASSP
jgi:CheY-like chemotaxis protein